MSRNRQKLIDLIEAMPDDQVGVLLADAERLSGDKPKRSWPPKFAGMIKDGPANGSMPEHIDATLAQGFGK